MDLWTEYLKQIAAESEAAWAEYGVEDEYPYGPISYGDGV
jgi:hypothetical protein